MSHLNAAIYDATLENHLDLMRIDAGARHKIIELLKNLEDELTSKVSVGMTAWSKARVAKQLSEASAIIRQYYDDAAGITHDTTTAAAQMSASTTAESLSVAVGGSLGAGTLPTAAFMETVADNTIIMGATQASWWKRQSDDTAWRFLTQVRMGLTAGETGAQMAKRVKDTLGLSQRNAMVLVKTSVMSVANETREKVFADHSDIIDGVEWVATLDARTCPACAVRDNKRWQQDGTPIDNSLPYRVPPIHFGDRCAMIPVLKSWFDLGIDLKEFPESTRASMEGQVTDKSFEAFAARKGAAWQDDVLGKGRADLWRRGVITFDQLVDGSGNPLSLKTLTEKYG